jgi:hypothetical protein
MQGRVRALSAVVLLVPLALVVTRCTVSDAVPWVKPSTAAPWIMPDVPVSADLHQWGEVEVPATLYTVELRPTGVAAGAALHVRALGDARVLLDGVEIATLKRAGLRGRAEAKVALAPRVGRVAALAVEVRNPYGPGLLAVTSEGLMPPLATGPHWIVAKGAQEPAPAIVADDTRRNARALSVATPREALVERAPALLGLCLLGAVLFAASGRLVSLDAAALFSAAAPVLATAAWLGPLAAKLQSIPMRVGFDAIHHMAYTKHIVVNGSLPDAAAGWSTYHPPLFYALSAAIVASGAGTAGLKLLLLLAGVASIWLAWMLARRLLPDAPAAAGLAALFAAVLPVNLYSSAYNSNEALHAALASAALLAVVTMLLREKTSLSALAGAALTFGAALLTKFTAVIIVPVALFFLAWKWLVIERLSLGRAARLAAVFAALLLAAAGWFYLRTYLTYGTPLLGNWNFPGDDQRWWHQPGFHTPAYYTSFGEALTRPYLAGFRSFWDALYSTAWGDGFIAGRTNPWQRHEFWNYAYMTAGYWLAVPATLLFGVGALVLAQRVLRDGEPRARLAIGFVLTASWAVFLAFTTLTFELALFGQAKAMYLLLLVGPSALAFAACYTRLHAGLPGWGQLLLASWLAAFAGTLFLGFAG